MDEAECIAAIERFCVACARHRLVAAAFLGGSYAAGHARADSDIPLYEVGMTMGGHRQEDRHWEHTLRSLAESFGVEGEVAAETVCVDRRRQWGSAGNVWHNAGIRSGMYTAAAPVRFATRPFRRGGG